MLAQTLKLVAEHPATAAGLLIIGGLAGWIAQDQLAIILTAFQCYLTRVATFSFAHGNSALRFARGR